jgi:hypothetical protein
MLTVAMIAVGGGLIVAHENGTVGLRKRKREEIWTGILLMEQDMRVELDFSDFRWILLHGCTGFWIFSRKEDEGIRQRFSHKISGVYR